MTNLNEQMVALGTQRSVIRELFEFGKIRAAEIGAENVFDFSIGNPSVRNRRTHFKRNGPGLTARLYECAGGCGRTCFDRGFCQPALPYILSGN